MSLVRRLAVVMLLVGVGFACSGPTGPSPSTASSQANAVLTLTNAERVRAGLGALQASEALARAAQIQADQIAQSGTLGHVIPNASYPHPSDRLAAVGYDWQAWAENLASGQASAPDVVAAWMGSSGHRANILSSAFTEMGTGHAIGVDGRPYYAQVFGRPKS